MAKQELKQRFAKVTEEDFSKLTEKHVAENTERNTKWAVRNFEEWRVAYNATTLSGRNCPEDLLQKADPKELNKWLARYIAETRREDGSQYPPKSLYSLLRGLLWHIRADSTCEAPNFLLKNDTRFKDLHNAMDNVYRHLNCKGIGLTTKKTPILTDADINALWQKGIIGKHAPTPLLRAVFFMLGMHACLRGGEEHRSLNFSMLTRGENCWTYLEPSSKNRPAGSTALTIKRKEVVIFATPEEEERCAVSILDTYMERVPTAAIKKCMPLFETLTRHKWERSEIMVCQSTSWQAHT